MTDDRSPETDQIEGESNDSPYSSLTGSFGSADIQAQDRFYTIEESEPFIEKLKSALQKSKAGADILAMAEEKGLSVSLIKSKKLQSATTPDLELFLAAEPDQKEPHMTQILEFAGALREIEQHIKGVHIPLPDSDPLERANKAHTKFLDKIVFMCKIGIDLEITYNGDVIEAIKAFGYEDIYNAQVNALGDDKAKEIYFKALEEAKKG